MRNFFSSYRAGLLALTVSGSLLAAAPARAQVPVAAPAWQAAVTASGSVTVTATATDASGNVLLTGHFSGGTATFGSTLLSSTSNSEVFVAKWSPASSSFVWALRGIGTAGATNSANAIAVSNGSVYLAGNFTGSTFALGSAPALANAQASTSDIFVAKLTDAGSSASVAWTRRAGGADNDYAAAIAGGAGNYVYVGGSNGAGASFGATTLAGAGGFICRLGDSLGTIGAAVAAGDGVTALVYNGGVYAAGTFRSGAATFGFGSSTRTLTSAGGEDIFVGRFDYYGLDLSWAQPAGGTGNDYADALVAANGRLYLAGALGSPAATFGSLTLPAAGAGSLYVAKLADTGTTGTFGWAVPSGGVGSAYNHAYGLAVTGSSVYLTGTVGGTTTLGATTLTSAGLSDILLAKLTDAGSTASFTWAQQAGGSGLDYAYGLARGGTQLYVGGQVSTPASFGSLPVSQAAGARPGFLASVTDTAPLLSLVAPTNAPVGSTVTLYGTGLAGATAITFAGTSNNVVTSGFTVNAAGTQISGIVVPAGAQTGVVNATSPLGTSNGLVTFSVAASANPAPAWQAALAGTSTSGSSRVQFSAPDASGNVFVGGTFSGIITLGATTLTSAGSDDLFVAKWSPATNTYVWAQAAGGTAAESIYGLAVSGTNVYIAGEFFSPTLRFGAATLTNTNTQLDGFVAKLTDAGTTGSFGWAQLIGGDDYDYVESLAVSGNNVYVGGDYYSSALLIGTGGLPTNAGSDDGYVAKFVDTGSQPTLSWVLQVGAPSATYLNTINFYGLAVRGNTVYAAGTLLGTVNVGGTQLVGDDNGDIAVTRITDAGSTASFTSAVQAGGAGQEWLYDLKVSGNTLYASGRNGSTAFAWGGTTLTGSGSTTGFLGKLTDSSTGLSFGWAQALGGQTNSLVYRLATNGTSVYAAGYFGGTAAFGPSTLSSAGGSDGFVAKVTDAGASASVAWAQQSGGIGSDINYSVALSGQRVLVGGNVTPAAAVGSLVLLASPGAPVATQVATLATLTDPTILATAPAASALAGGLVLYPNPAHGRTTAQLPASAEKLPLLLYDAMGREARRYPAPGSAVTEASLSLSGLTPGVYVLRCGASSQRLLVE